MRFLYILKIYEWEGDYMKRFLNAIIILFSLYTVFTIIRGEQSLIFYLMLFLVEWLLIMICNPMLRKVTFSKLYHSKSMGGENYPYGIIDYNNVEEIISSISPEAFIELVKDVLRLKGYKVEEEGQLDDNFMASLDDRVVTVKVKVKSEETWEVQSDFIKEVVSNSIPYSVMIVTNGRFNKGSTKVARKMKVTLVNESRLITWIREILHEEDMKGKKLKGENNPIPDK